MIAYLVLDIGSSSVRASLLDATTGVLLAGARRPVSAHPHGCYDPDALLQAATEVATECQQTAVAQHGIVTITDVGFACFVGNILAVEAAAAEIHSGSGSSASAAAAAVASTAAPKAVTLLYTYANSHPDSPAAIARTASSLAGAGGAGAAFDRVGAPLHPAYATAAIPLARAQLAAAAAPGQASKQLVWCSLVTYILSHWLGLSPASAVGMSPSEAAWAGLLQWSSGTTAATTSTSTSSSGGSKPQYDAAALAALQLVEAGTGNAASGCDFLPRLRVSEEQLLASPAPAYAAAFPCCTAAAASPVRWHLGLGDGVAASIGAGCMRAPTASLTIGTSAAVRVILPLATATAALCAGTGACTTATATATTAAAEPGMRCTTCGKIRLSSAGLFCYRFSSSHVLVGGALTDAGSLVAWAIATTGLQPEALALSAADAPSQLICLPFWSGERATGWQGSAARGVLYGLSHGTGPHAILQAALEGVSYRLRAIYERLTAMLATAGVDIGSYAVVCSGGGIARNGMWQRVLANVLQRRVAVEASEVETTTRGVFMAMQGTEAVPNTTSGSSGSSSGTASEEDSSSAGAVVVVQPSGDAGVVAAYQAAYARSQLLYEHMRTVNTLLATTS